MDSPQVEPLNKTQMSQAAALSHHGKTEASNSTFGAFKTEITTFDLG